MATETAAAANTGSSTPAKRTARRFGQLWQTPIFVLGVALLAYVIISRLIEHPDPVRQFHHDIHTVRQILEHGDGDLEAALAAGQRAVDTAPTSRQGEAHFLLGSVYLSLAGTKSGDSAVKQFRLARDLLEKSQQLGIPDGDVGKLTYRLGRAGFYTGDDIFRVTQRLQHGIEYADDQAEGYRLLALAYLKLPQPDLAAALKANEKLRLMPRVGEDTLSSARLQAGEILLGLGKPDEARKALEKVGKEAPPAILSRSRILRARTFQDERRWAEAAVLWRAALSEDHAAAPEQAIQRYNLGLCLAKTDQPKDAARVWEECVRDSKGDEGLAAALALAELWLTDVEPEKALSLLKAVARSVPQPGEWHNSLIDPDRARKIFKEAIKVYRTSGRTALALETATAYERLALPGEAQALRAEAAARGAHDCRDLAHSAKAGDRAKLENEARVLSTEAAASYTRAADAQARPADGAEFLWLAAACAFDAHDEAQAAGLLERLLTIDQKPQRMAEGWYLLAETRRRQGKETAAIKAYRQSIKYPTPFEYRARYQLALIAIKNGELDEGEAALTQNLKLLRMEGVDSDAQEKSLFALGALLYQRRNYRMVVRQLEEALGRFPANPEATRAHYQLAESYYVLGAEENQRFILGNFRTQEAKEHSLREYRRWLQKAAEEYAELAKALESPETRVHLTPEEAAQVPFLEADCKYNLGNYEDALQIYEKLAAKSQGIDRLNALGFVVRCLAALSQMDKMHDRLEEIRKLLATMDKNVQDQWQGWLVIASKPFAKGP